jgi:hypothetical protein
MGAKRYADPWTLPAIAALLILSAGAVLLSAGVEHPALFSYRPLQVPGTSWTLPAEVYHLALPLLIAVSHRVAVRRVPSHIAVRAALTLLAAVAVASVWVTDLPLRSRWLTLLHCILLPVVVLPGRIFPLSRRNLSLMAVSGGLAASISYGAIWGETRCDEPAPVRCLDETGLRARIPVLLAKLGLPAFAELRDADLRGLDLSGRDLRYAELSGSDLRGADLSGVNLRRARLDDVRAAGSRWRSAYLDGATMANADLRDADMRGIHAYRLNLTAADLRRSDLRGASLSHAYLAAATFAGARLQGAYLRFAEGLASGQLAGACADQETLASPGISLPVCSAP